jgi:hypothetical protein
VAGALGRDHPDIDVAGWVDPTEVDAPRLNSLIFGMAMGFFPSRLLRMFRERSMVSIAIQIF